VDIKQLRYFSVIADEGQVSRAAKKLHMAQPPLSHHLKMLEQELGVTLMARNGRRMELTESGKVLLERAQKILQYIDDTVQEVRETGQGVRGVLSIGAVKSSFSFLPGAIRTFRSQYPLVKFHLREGDSYTIGERVKSREIELGLVRLPLDLSGMNMVRLQKEPYVAAYPKQWKQEIPAPLALKDMKDWPLLLLHRINGIGQFEMIIEECRRHGFEPNVICECPDVAMLLSLVAEGVGASIVPRSALNAFPLSNVEYSEITDISISAESALIWLKERYLSRAALKFLNMFVPGGIDAESL
jgi:DNA-binding transcriptional LysR family regulator